MAQERYVVSAAKLNVKKTASAEAATIGNLVKGTEVDVYGFDGGWAEIKYGDGTAFVAMKLIEKAAMDEPKPKNTLTSNDLKQKSENKANANANATIELSLKRKRKHTDDGYQWYEHVYKAKIDGETKTFMAAFNEDEKRITPIIEADYLSYTNGFFEMGTKSGHALYDKQGNCIIPSRLGFNNIWVHPDEGKIVAYNSKNEEKTRRAFTLDGKPCKDFPNSYNHHKDASDDDNEDEAEDLEDFYEHVRNGNEHLADCDYKAAARSYKKALKHQKDAGVLYNLGVAQYNDGKYRGASKSFDEAYTIAKSQKGNSSLAEKALQMKRKSANLAKEKSQEVWGTVALVASTALAVTAAAVAETELQKLEMEQQKQQSVINSNNKRATSSSYDDDNYYDDDDNYYEKESPKPKKQKKCGFCNGRGWNVEYATSFGLAEKEYCSECGKTMMSNHYHKTCTHCDGTGYE